MNRILVTGGSGFIGNAIVKKLVSQGHDVYITGRHNEQNITCPCLSYTFHDLDWKSIPSFDIIFHQAAIADTLHPVPDDFYFVNVTCSQTLFKKALQHGCKRFIYASSCAVYGNVPSPFVEDGAKSPMNDYGASKLEFDEWAIPWSQQEGVMVAGLRYSNVYGCGESHKGKSASMIWQLAQQIIAGNRPRLFKWGEQERDFVYIDDVINCNLLASNVNHCGVFNVGSGKPTSFNQIIEIITDVFDFKVDVEYIDNPIEKYYQTRTICDLNKSETLLGYCPQTNIEEGIEKYLLSPCFSL